MFTIPDPYRYNMAQISAMLAGNRDSVLITPGSAIPPLPDGATQHQTSRGLLYTTNPSKVDAVDKGSEEDAGKALFGYGYDQSKGFDTVAVGLLGGIPVAELAVKPGDERRALAAARLLSPDGRATLVPRERAIKDRIIGLLSEVNHGTT